MTVYAPDHTLPRFNYTQITHYPDPTIPGAYVSALVVLVSRLWVRTTFSKTFTNVTFIIYLLETKSRSICYSDTTCNLSFLLLDTELIQHVTNAKNILKGYLVGVPTTRSENVDSSSFLISNSKFAFVLIPSFTKYYLCGNMLCIF